MHRVMDHNQLFYCTNNEIVVGDMPKTNMGPIHAEVCTHTKNIFLLRLLFLLDYNLVCALKPANYVLRKHLTTTFLPSNFFHRSKRRHSSPCTSWPRICCLVSSTLGLGSHWSSRFTHVKSPGRRCVLFQRKIQLCAQAKSKH